MTPGEFMAAGFLVLACVGWWQAITARRHDDTDPQMLPSAYQLRAGEKQRLVRAEANRRCS